MATVKDLQQALVKDGVLLIAGEEGIDQGIDYLTVQEFSFKSSRIPANGFIMTTFYGFKNINEIIQHFEWYAKKGISGIGFHTAIYREIPKRLIEIANEFKLPLLYIPEDMPYHIIYEKYNDLNYQETTKLKNSIEKLNQDMLDALVLEKDIHFIIQSIGKYLRVPIIYLNRDKEIVSLWNTVPIYRADLRTMLDGLLTNYYDLFDTARRKNEWTNEINLHKVSKLDSVLIIPLGNNMSFYGFLLIINQKMAVPFQDSILKNAVTALILDGIKKNQTIEFQKNKDIRLFEDIFLNNRLDALKVEDFYYDINRLHSIIIAEPENSNDLKKTYQLLHKYLEETDPNALVWIMERKVIALLQMEFKFNVPDNLNLKLGISNKIKGISNERVQLLYEQANVSLHFAHIQEKPVCKWKDLRIEPITYFIRETALLKDFYQETLQDLIQYDQENQTELVKTLYVYLNTFFSLKESGDKLHLHPNTVKYRIKKIEEIIPIDFHDSDQFIDLMISLKSYLYEVECNSFGKV